jgi:hypothetical protein
MNGRYDPALLSIAGGESGANATHVNEIGRLFLDTVQSAVLGGARKNAAFVTACSEHCGQWAQGSDGDFDVIIDGLTAIPALMQWRAANFAPQLWVQAPGDTYPCAACCKGGQ